MLPDMPRRAPYFGLPPLQDGTTHLPVEELASSIADMKKQIALLEGRVLSTSALLNYQRPINRLPPEILLEIFRRLRNNDRTYRSYRRGWMLPSEPPWHRVLGVCRYWHSLASSTPLLWTSVPVGGKASSAMLQAFISRSCQLPIDVAFRAMSSTALADALDQLHPHAGRTKALSFRDLTYQEKHVKPIADLLAQCEEMTILKTLSVAFKRDDSTLRHGLLLPLDRAFTATFSPERFPRIRNLSLQSIDARLPALGLPCLVSLTLTQARTATIPFNDFIAFLRGCSRLEVLSLSFFRPSQPGMLEVLPLPQVVHLPSTFRTLRIEELDIFAARLLGALHIPLTADVTVAALLDPKEIGEVRNAHELTRIPIHSCLPPDISGLPIIPKITTLRIRTGDEVCTVSGIAGEYGLWLATLSGIKGSRPVAPDPADTLITVFRSSPLTELRLINLGARQVAIEHWIAALQHFPCLHRLTATMNWWSFPNNSRRNILRALGTTMVHGSMLCPQLAVLDLNSPEPLKDTRAIEEMVRCLQVRKTKGFPIQTLRIGLGETAISDSDDEAGYTEEDFPPSDERKATFRAALRHHVDKLLFWDSEWDEEDYHVRVRITSPCRHSRFSFILELFWLAGLDHTCVLNATARCWIFIPMMERSAWRIWRCYRFTLA